MTIMDKDMQSIKWRTSWAVLERLRKAAQHPPHPTSVGNSARTADDLWRTVLLSDLQEVLHHLSSRNEEVTPRHTVCGDWKDETVAIHGPHGWHLPYVTMEERKSQNMSDLLAMSAARCATISNEDKVKFEPRSYDAFTDAQKHVDKDVKNFRNMMTETQQNIKEKSAFDTLPDDYETGDY